MSNIFRQISFILIIPLTFQGCQRISFSEEEKSLLYFTSTPVTCVFHNDAYLYKILATGRTQTLTFRSVVLPGWLEFNCDSQTLTGTATADNLGSTHTPYHWTHDGKPLTGDNCIVCSDAAKDDSKLFISEKAENSFLNLKDLLQIDNNNIFVFPSGTNKLDFYANRFKLEYQGGFAYYGGSLVISPDSPMYRPLEAWCANQVEHEMMHEIEYLLEARPPSLMTDVWFREGLADFYACRINLISSYLG